MNETEDKRRWIRLTPEDSPRPMYRKAHEGEEGVALSKEEEDGLEPLMPKITEAVLRGLTRNT